MILSDTQILSAVASGDIVIDPFDRKNLGSNSYDVRLGPTMARYKDAILDAKIENAAEFFEIGPDGIVLVPNQLYLGVTAEQVGSRKYVPFVDGKSSSGRLGISVHVTAGRGDVGFFGAFTLEIFVIQAVRVYAGMPIGQFTFYETGDIEVPYDKKSSAKYGGSLRPQLSAMWKNFIVEPHVSPVTRCEHKSAVLKRLKDRRRLLFIFIVRCPDCGREATREVTYELLQSMTQRELALFQERLARLQ